MRLFVLFVLVPIVEIYLLIQVGGLIGALPTVALVLLTAAVGAAMLRQQGLATLARARRALDSGQPPARELMEGVILLLGGAMLLTPGFVTDALGFFCLVPRSRQWLIAQLLQNVRIIQPRSPGSGFGPRGPRSTERRQDSRTIEGEWHRDD